MKFFTATMLVAVGTMAALPAAAAPAKMTDAQLDLVVAGTDYTCPPPETTAKGNNGWGNGTDGTNPGSFNGATAPSKTSGLSEPAFGKINTNPTMSSGR